MHCTLYMCKHTVDFVPPMKDKELALTIGDFCVYTELSTQLNKKDSSSAMHDCVSNEPIRLPLIAVITVAIGGCIVPG